MVSSILAVASMGLIRFTVDVLVITEPPSPDSLPDCTKELQGFSGPKERSLRMTGEAPQEAAPPASSSQICLGCAQMTPHPARDGWRKRRRGPPSPQGRGLHFRREREVHSSDEAQLSTVNS